MTLIFGTEVSDQEAHRQRPVNLTARRIFEGEDLAKLTETTPIKDNVVTWDVSVPLRDDRLVFNDEVVRQGAYEKKRIELGLSYIDSRLVVTLSNLHASRSIADPEMFGRPVMSDDGDIFSPEHGAEDSFDTLLLAIDATGQLDMYGISGDEAQTIYSGDSDRDDNYQRCANIAERMLRVPLLEGTLRAPIKS